MSKKELFKRYLLFTASLFFAALGVAITRHGELGVSPISSVANVMSYQFPSLSLGTWPVSYTHLPRSFRNPPVPFHRQAGFLLLPPLQ